MDELGALNERVIGLQETVDRLREELAEARSRQVIQIPRLRPGDRFTIEYPGSLVPAVGGPPCPTCAARLRGEYNRQKEWLEPPF
jgi:hypothetical protein